MIVTTATHRLLINMQHPNDKKMFGYGKFPFLAWQFVT